MKPIKACSLGNSFRFVQPYRLNEVKRANVFLLRGGKPVTLLYQLPSSYWRLSCTPCKHRMGPFKFPVSAWRPSQQNNQNPMLCRSWRMLSWNLKECLQLSKPTEFSFEPQSPMAVSVCDVPESPRSPSLLRSTWLDAYCVSSVKYQNKPHLKRQSNS